MLLLIILVDMAFSSWAHQKLPVIFVSGIPLFYWDVPKLSYLLFKGSVQCMNNWAAPGLAQSAKVLSPLQIKFGNPCFVQFYRVSQTWAALDEQSCLKHIVSIIWIIIAICNATGSMNIRKNLLAMEGCIREHKKISAGFLMETVTWII